MKMRIGITLMCFVLCGKAQMLDQYHVIENGGMSARTGPGYCYSQSFMAGITGTLVEVQMAFFGAVKGKGILKIYSGEDTTTLLQAVPVKVDNKTYRYYNRFKAAVPVQAGSIYTFRFIPGKGIPDVFGLLIGSPGRYLYGTSPDHEHNTDFLFKTVVVPSVDPDPSSTKGIGAFFCFFTSFNSTLDPAAGKVLDELAEQLKSDPQLFLEVEGHADSSGLRSINDLLSRKRAQAVKQFLVQKGIAEQRLHVVSKGASQPLAPNRTAEGRAMNRRVSFKVTVPAKRSWLTVAERKMVLRHDSAEKNRLRGLYCYFEWNSSTLSAASLKLLDTLAERMRADHMCLEIRGHCDSLENDPLMLSQKRAEKVKAYLASKGAPATGLFTIGLGPKLAGKENRRVGFRDIYFLPYSEP